MSAEHAYPAVYATGHSTIIQGNIEGGLQLSELTREQRCHQLFKTAPYEEFKDRNPPRVDGTCQWALEHKVFCDWRSSTHDALLWISADPGCGKSVLAKSLVDRDLPGDRMQYSICYFFFKDNEEQDNLTTALCALLHQLFDQQPSLLRHAVASWEKNGDKLRQESRAMWRVFLQCAADRSAPPILCVLDALDECGEVDRRELIAMLCDVQHEAVRAAKTSLKILVTSRPYDNVQRWFAPTATAWPHIRLRGEDENDQINKEINLVIDRRMRDVARESHLSDTDHERIRQELLHMRHRTYLWLHLAMEEVRQLCQDSLFADEIEIELLPKSVEDAYERILSKIKDKQKTLARQVLLIVVGARRPLSLKEISQALLAARAYEQSSSRLGKIDEARLENQIREQCGLFVFFNHSQIFLIHQTAKEFLVARGPSFQPVPGLWRSSFDENDVERTMALWCITFLTLTQRNMSRNSKRDPKDLLSEQRHSEDCDGFFKYCAEHWTSHLQKNDPKQDDFITSRAVPLLDTEAEPFRAWFPIFWKTFGWVEGFPILRMQHVASMCGLAFLLKTIFQRARFDVEASDSRGSTAFHWAARCGHTSIVRWLLDQGANVNAEGQDHFTALQLASAEGHEEIVKILVDAEAIVDARGDLYSQTALQMASGAGHEIVVQTLLDAGADMNFTGGYNEETPLQSASRLGHEKVVKVLVKAGAELDALAQGSHQTALQAAALGGHGRVVQVLVDAGANVNARGADTDDTALQFASQAGYMRVVQILLDAGADMNARGRDSFTAMMRASKSGWKDVVQTLVDAGADVNAGGGYNFGTALMAASEGGKEEIAQMLLNAGADVNVEGGINDTALIAASWNGHEHLVQILLAAGADINAQGALNMSALHAASKFGHEEVVQLLVNAGADIDTRGAGEITALIVASGRGHEKVVQILVDAGADVNAPRSDYGTAFQVASEGGYDKVIEILLKHGVTTE